MNHRHVALAVVAAVAIVAAAVLDGAPPTAEPGPAAAPGWAHALRNPYQDQPDAAAAGLKLFERHCAQCHGEGGRGLKNAPALTAERTREAAPGDLFWFITNGNLRKGMPAWSRLPEARRWQLVAYLKGLRPDAAR